MRCDERDRPSFCSERQSDRHKPFLSAGIGVDATPTGWIGWSCGAIYTASVSLASESAVGRALNQTTPLEPEILGHRSEARAGQPLELTDVLSLPSTEARVIRSNGSSLQADDEEENVISPLFSQ